MWSPWTSVCKLNESWMLKDETKQLSSLQAQAPTSLSAASPRVPCLPFCQAQPAGISGVGSGHFSGFQGLFLRISSWRPGIRRLSPGIRRFSRRWDQRLFFPHPLLPLACYSRAQHFWRRGFMPARPRKLLLSREEASKAERQEVHSLCRPPAPAEHIVLRAKLDASPSLAAKQASSRRADPCLSTR